MDTNEGADASPTHGSDLVTPLVEELAALRARQEQIQSTRVALDTEEQRNADDILAIGQLLVSRGHPVADQAAVEVTAGSDRDSTPTPERTTREAIQELLASESRAFTVREIIDRLNEFGSSAQEVTVRSYITRMSRDNEIHRAERGAYTVRREVPRSRGRR